MKKHFLCESLIAGILDEVSSKSIKTILKWKVVSIYWYLPGFEYSTIYIGITVAFRLLYGYRL